MLKNKNVSRLALADKETCKTNDWLVCSESKETKETKMENSETNPHAYKNLILGWDSTTIQWGKGQIISSNRSIFCDYENYKPQLMQLKLKSE